MSQNYKNNRIVRANYLNKGDAFNTNLFKADTVVLDSTLSEGDVLIRSLYLAHDPCKLSSNCTLLHFLAWLVLSLQ